MKQFCLYPDHFHDIFTGEDSGDQAEIEKAVVSKAVAVHGESSSVRNALVLVGNTLDHVELARDAEIGFIAIASGVQREKLLQTGVAPEQIIPNLDVLPSFLGLPRTASSM